MTTKHTQGNWYFDLNLIERNEHGTYGLPICTDNLDQFLEVILDSSEPNDEELANASLISAAPDMLEALQEYMSAYNDNRSLMKFYRLAEDAIKKATTIQP